MGAPENYRAVAEALEPFILHEMADKKLSGLSIALVDDQSVVWARGFGFANPDDSTPASAETVYRVGSIAKLFTTVGVLQLAELRRLNLDAPVARYLPDFRPGGAGHRPVTVRQLLTHRSGLAREPPVGSMFDSSRASLEKTAASLFRSELVYRPGTRTKYSNAGMALAGYLIERIQAESFEDYAARAIFRPMGLRSTSFRLDSALRARLAQGRLWTPDGRAREAPAFRLGNAPAGGLYSTAGDLAQFARVLFAGGRGPEGPVLKAETIERMWTPPIRDSGAAPADFGLGFWMYPLDGRQQVGHWASFYGHSTELAIIPGAKLAAAVSTTEDQANGVIARIANAALGMMLAAKQGRKVAAPVTTAPVPAEVARRLDGRYVSGRSDGQTGRRSALWPEDSSTVRPSDRPTVDLEERSGRLFFHRAGDEAWFELRALGGTLVVDDRLAFGERLVPLGIRILSGGDTLAEMDVGPPAPPPERWRELIGEYGWDYATLYVREEGGRLHALLHSSFDYPLIEHSPNVFRLPDSGLYHGEQLVFVRDRRGRVV
ncbi:MAG: beta-lactamase family protein, partial [Gemmatimonadetes bacterium]|nr:beta-lactamase family protein [Gemmatimonadota bacterium]